MSRPFTRYLDPTDIVRRPSLEPEVQRTILASWGCTRMAVGTGAPVRRAPLPKGPIEDGALATALRSPARRGMPGTLR